MTDKSSRTTNIYVPQHDSVKAIAALEANKGLGIVVGDHASGETCASAIARLQNTNRNRVADPGLSDTARTAVVRLRAGKGLLLNDTNHSGGNTCVQVIVANTTA